MIYKDKNYMTGKDEGEFKGFKFRLNGYCGFDIQNKEGSNIFSFQPIAGNNLLNYNCLEIRNKLLSMIRYRINKYLIKKK